MQLSGDTVCPQHMNAGSSIATVDPNTHIHTPFFPIRAILQLILHVLGSYVSVKPAPDPLSLPGILNLFPARPI